MRRGAPRTSSGIPIVDKREHAADRPHAVLTRTDAPEPAPDTAAMRKRSAKPFSTKISPWFSPCATMGLMNETFPIPIDERALAVLRAIESTGASAWFVGGCVRDALLGKTAHDFDIASSAPWQTVAELFSARGLRVIETGAAHGSVGIVNDGLVVEVTAYRVEAGYSDARRPDSVTFVDDIRTDLARRDFRMNAMAYHPERGLLDPFEGARDIEQRIVRTVGAAHERFEEDPLRIMRGLRFCAQLGFKTDEETEKALFECAESLDLVAKERLFSELSKLIEGPGAGYVLARYAAVVSTAVPGFARLANGGCTARKEARSPLESTALTVDAAPADAAIRFAALFCEMSGPNEGESAAQTARAALETLRAPRALIKRTVALIESLRDAHETDHTGIALLVASHGGDIDFARQLFALRRARAKAHGGDMQACARQAAILDALQADGTPLSRCDLAVSGQDLIDRGMRPGPGIARTLDALLHAAICGRIGNNREELLFALDEAARAEGGTSADANPTRKKYRKKSLARY